MATRRRLSTREAFSFSDPKRQTSALFLIGSLYKGVSQYTQQRPLGRDVGPGLLPQVPRPQWRGSRKSTRILRIMCEGQRHAEKYFGARQQRLLEGVLLLRRNRR